MSSTMVETSTTDLFPYYMYYDYDYTEENKQEWCINQNYTMMIIAGVFTVVCLCGLVGNTVVVWFLGFHMKKNPFTVYVLNLAIADFSLLLFILVIITVFIISKVNCFSLLLNFIVHDILMVLFLFWYLASMYLLTAMSMERCLSVLFPIWYQYRRPKYLSGIVCGMLWALAALFASLVFLNCSSRSHMRCAKALHGFSTVHFLIFCFLPLLSNLFLFIRLRCGSQRRHPGRLYVAILLSMSFMFIFGLPLCIVTWLPGFLKRRYILYIGYLLASLNSCINPVIYFLVGSCRKRLFQCSVGVALRRVFEEKVKSEERSQVTGDTVVVEGTV